MTPACNASVVRRFRCGTNASDADEEATALAAHDGGATLACAQNYRVTESDSETLELLAEDIVHGNPTVRFAALHEAANGSTFVGVAPLTRGSDRREPADPRTPVTHVSRLAASSRRESASDRGVVERAGRRRRQARYRRYGQDAPKGTAPCTSSGARVRGERWSDVLRDIEGLRLHAGHTSDASAEPHLR